jgi:hypothetical protein
VERASLRRCPFSLSLRGAADRNDNESQDADCAERQSKFADHHEGVEPPGEAALFDAHLRHTVDHRCDGNDQGDGEGNGYSQPRKDEAFVGQIGIGWNRGCSFAAGLRTSLSQLLADASG